jgi:hypothetical protein
MTHIRRGRQRTRHRPAKVRLFEFATRTIKSWLTRIVGFVIDRLGVVIYLKGMAFGAVSMIVGFVIDLLGVVIYLKGMAFGAVSMIVGFVIDLLGVAFHDLCLVFEFRLP